MTQDTILKRSDLLQIREEHFLRLEHLLTGDKPDQPFFLQGIDGEGVADPYREPEHWVDQALNSLAERVESSKDPLVFRPLCLEFRPFGLHFTDCILGAVARNSDERWWVERFNSPIGSLPQPAWEDSDTWKLAQRLAIAFRDTGVSLPLFGMPIVAGSLTLAVDLYGPDFLEALLLDPQSAQRDLETITRVTRKLYEWYFENLPPELLQQTCASVRCMPPGFISIYGCTTHLLSAEIYADLIAPFDEAVLACGPRGGLIHLCGTHVQHIAAWKRMKPLRAVQINDLASADLAQYFEGLREDQIIYLHPTEDMTVERALDITGGRRLVIVSEPANQN